MISSLLDMKQKERCSQTHSDQRVQRENAFTRRREKEDDTIIIIWEILQQKRSKRVTKKEK